VIPQRLLVDREKDGEKIEHAGLPFDIKVVNSFRIRSSIP